MAEPWAFARRLAPAQAITFRAFSPGASQSSPALPKDVGPDGGCRGKSGLTQPARCGHYAGVRKLFRRAEIKSRQGARWPKFAGCVLALMLLATSAVANPQLDTSNPTGFFTNVAMAMFQQMNLRDFNGNLVTVTNIPIYEDPTLFGGTNINYYTPAVHRILQLAANIFDATTNRFIDGGPTNYPTVFRPVFRSLNGVASIVGYEEVTNSDPVFLPFLDVTNFVLLNQPFNDVINIYGVPWVIGAKKGFPNFNEFSMNNALTCTRKIEFTNSTATFPWQTNQLFNFAITNSFGIEAWNSYTNAYGRSLRLVVTNELKIQLTANQGGTMTPLLAVQNLPFGNDLTFASGWPGWNRDKTDTSFQVPLYVLNDFTNGIYIDQSPFIVPLNPPRWDLSTDPTMYMTLGFRLRYALIDTSVNPNRVLDFVNLVDTEQPVNITSTLANNDSTGQVDNPNIDGEWDTNLHNGTLVGPLNQIFASEGAFTPSDWHDTPAHIAEETTLFRQELTGGITNYFLTPYNPTRTIYQGISWEANDPLVHYTRQDMTSTNGFQKNFNIVSLSQGVSPLSNLTNLNFAYQPWGGYHLPGQGSLNPNKTFDDNYLVKDPMVEQSDDWNFPTGESLTFDWLGRVHRGTPWQTVFLKPSNQSVAQWGTWDSDNIVFTNVNGYIYIDAAFTYPNNDWHIASLWAQWVNTNHLSALLLSTNSNLLSINNTDTNAWAARLDGLTAFTNSVIGELDPITISSNSLQAGIIAQAIQAARANVNYSNGPVFQNRVFWDAGDVLATPELSIASPFLNTNGMNSLAANGITDEALEIIPTQLLPLLRVDSIGQIAAFNGLLDLHFSGYDGHTYAIQASSNLTDWVSISTNCPSDGIFEVITNTAPSDQQFYRSVLLY